MNLSQTGCEVSLGSYKTPLGKLAKQFKGSVELWKAKYRQLRSEIKRYQNRANDEPGRYRPRDPFLEANLRNAP